MKLAAQITKLPPYIRKWQQLATADREGAKNYSIIYVDDDKIAQAQLWIVKVMSLYWKLEGFRYTLEPVFSQTDMKKMFATQI